MAKKFWNGQNKEIIVEDLYVVMDKMDINKYLTKCGKILWTEGVLQIYKFD